jgi:hypothetical protein
MEIGHTGTWAQVAARVAPLGKPTDEQLDAIRAHLVDPAVLDEHAPFVFRAVVSNSQVDSYFTRMAESSLRNYAADAEAGVSLLSGHDHRSIPLGRSFGGRYIGPGGNGTARVEEDFYILRGLNVSGTSTDDFIASIRGGVARDVSIGFHRERRVCSICGADWLRSPDCIHWPGMEYPVLKNGKPSGETQIAYLWVEDAHQAEASIVFEGATPDCMVLKARQMDAAGLIKRDVAAVLEQRYRIRLPGAQPTWAGHRDAAQEDPMPEETTSTLGDQEQPNPEPETETPPAAPTEPDGTRTVIAAARQALVDAGQEAGTELVAGIRQLAQENARLRPLADDGRAYRTDLIAEALAEGVRAQGEGFAADTYRSLLETAPLATVKRFRDDWKALGDQVFRGGRQTTDTHEPKPAAAPPRAIPDAAFAA